MADTPDDKSKQPPAVPDLKKVAEAKAAEPYAWAAPAPVAKSAASAANIVLGAPRREPTPFERLNSTPGRLAVMALLMLVVGGGLSLTAFHDSGSSGGGSDLSKPNSTIKSRAFFEKDGVSLTRGRDDSKADRMKINAKAAATDGFDTGGPGNGTGVTGAEGGDGGEPLNYDTGGGKGKSVASAAGAQGAGGDGAQGGGGAGGSASGGMAAPKLSSTGKIKFQGMRRISGTAGFRGIGGRQGTPSKINTRGSAANSAATDPTGRGGAKGGTGFSSPSSSGGTGAGGSSAGQDDTAGGGGAGGGSGGGGSGGVNTDGVEELDDDLPGIPGLLQKAADKRKKAGDEEKKGHALMVLGQHPQAAYHFNKAHELKKEAKDYENQANQQTQAMQDTAAGMTPTTPP